MKGLWYFGHLPSLQNHTCPCLLADIDSPWQSSFIKERIMKGIDEINAAPVVHRWNKFADDSVALL
jgi:hypothetical protein